MQYEDKILEAVDMIVQNAVSKASYDRTIQGKVLKCEDSTIGKYKVQYQDSTFYAYSNNFSTIYTEGMEIYILIPANDMSRDKTILGSVEKLGSNYISEVTKEESFEINGNNCINFNGAFNLCSYQTTNKILYSKEDNINFLRLNLKDIENYIKDTSSLIISAKVKTNLPIEQQYSGNYGLLYELIFEDNASGELITKNYILDINQFEGNPYKISIFKKQYGIFNIDSKNFKYINKISLFCYGFPNQEDGKSEDIFIKDLGLFCGNPLSQEDLTSCSLSFVTPQGTYFDNNDLDSATRTLQAQVKVKGKAIDVNSQKLPYYWFVEDNSVDSSSPKYCSYGGNGWRCLNNYNTIEKNGNTSIEWVPADYTYTIKKSDNEAKEVKYKCVVIYNSSLSLLREITITNYSSNYNISIVSDGGNQFYYDIGHPTLTCLVNGREELDSSYSYQWAEIDNNNNFSTLNETLALNEQYHSLYQEYEELKKAIAAEIKFEEANKEKIAEYLTDLKSYEKIIRVERNKIINLQINKITNFSTYKCSVYKNGIYIGTSSIIIKNSLDKKEGYQLIINNGTQIFKYDESGVAPTSSSLANPQVILPLTFSIYDDLGNLIEEENLKGSKIKWTVPAEDTLLEISDIYSPLEENSYKIIENESSLNYSIRNNYDIKKSNNNIKLEVIYKDMILTADTNFTFTKEGNPGTNGTAFVCKIMPNTQDKDFGYPMVLNNTLNFTPKQEKKWFIIEFWHNGTKIYSGNESGITLENKNINIKWSILKNKYTTSISDSTSIEVTANGDFSYLGYKEDTPANIIKAEIIYDDLQYFATLPLVTAIATEGYSVSLERNSGFDFVTYSADGRKPQYNNSKPFELKVMKNINGTNENISELTKENSINYDWNIRGSIYDPVKREWVGDPHLEENNRNKTNLKRNQSYFKPSDEYDGECINNALECYLIDNSGIEVAKIHIPIHLLLNRYSNAALNDWDGNSVNLDKDGLGVILAPQMGAGQKEEDNSFTGLLMGSVKEAGKNKKEIGLFGYNFGERTIFLNAKDGSAIFGKQGPGQIILDPKAKKAMLYSSGYWKEYNEEGKPLNYNDSNINNSGMLIDLTTPAIRWGNGNFAIDADGHMIVKGGGSFAGFNIDDDSIFTNSKDSSENVRLSSSDFSRIINGSQRDNLRLALGNKFAVSADGRLYASAGDIGGWTINGTELLSNNGNTHISSSGSLRGPNWEINSNGDATFNNVVLTQSGYNRTVDIIDFNNFKVNSKGVMTATNGKFKGSIDAGSTISGSAIEGGSIDIGSKKYYLRMGQGTKNPEVSGLTIGTQGLVVGSAANFNGNCTLNSGIILNKMSGSDITLYTGDFEGQYKGQTTKTIGFNAVDGNIYYLKFYKGILVSLDTGE